jgi:hypothetical protein
MALIVPDKYKKNKHTYQYFYKPSKEEEAKPDAEKTAINPSEVSVYNRKVYPSDNIYKAFMNVIPYNHQLKNPKTTVQVGQVKLFIALSDFLLELPEPPPDKKYTLVYAGAACGTNIFLAEPFFRKKIKKYILIDPNKFIKPSVYIIKPNYSVMEIHNTLFTDELLEKIVKKNTDIVFMSDIRTSEARGCPRDRNVIRDNDLQKNWVLKINPIMASLKFRMPFTDIGRKGIDDTIYDSDVYPYLKGTVKLQAYAQKGSTESRLILKPPYTYKNYSISEQENRFFSFNRVYRSCAYLDPLFLADASDGVFDACYDCTHFYLTAKKILEYYGRGSSGGAKGDRGAKGDPKGGRGAKCDPKGDPKGEPKGEPKGDPSGVEGEAGGDHRKVFIIDDKDIIEFMKKVKTILNEKKYN